LKWIYKYLLAGLILTAGLSAHTAGADSIFSATPFTASDSLIFLIFSNDTIVIPRYSQPFIPVYHPNHQADTLKKSENTANSSTSNDLLAHGYISRGIQLGDARGLSLQSGMNLRIQGNFGPGITLSGVLNDQNSPLQPLGNTQTLNDFDKVYIRMEGPNFSSQIGDIQLSAPETNALATFDRKTNGIWFSANHGKWHSYAGGGFSYGNYNRQTIQPVDGKQGPYLLTGRNGESYILVLAGTEKVWLDGLLLTRGETNDYTIDYNSAELNFTNQHMLSLQNRVVVEFEYATDAYLGGYSFGKQLVSLQFGYGDTTSGFSWGVTGNLIQDDAHNPLGDISSDSLKTVLQNIPAPDGQIWLSTIVEDSSGDYSLAGDTLVYQGAGNGTHRARFTFVGTGRGSYEKLQNARGAIYYKYSEARGSFIPSRAYTAPDRQITSGYHLSYNSDRLKTWFKGALAEFNPNTYAAQSNPKRSPGWRGGIRYDLPTAMGKIGVRYEGENLAADFKPFQPAHQAEYYRNWQIKPRDRESDVFHQINLKWSRNNRSAASIDIAQFRRERQLVGVRYSSVGAIADTNHWGVTWNDRILNFQDHRSWQRHNWQVRWNFKQWFVGGKFESEAGQPDTLNYLNNSHVTNGFLLGYRFSTQNAILADYQRRTDIQIDSVANPRFLAWQVTGWTEYRDDYGIKLVFHPGEFLHGNGKLTYRRRYSDPEQPGIYNAFVLANSDIAGELLDQRLNYQSTFELNEERIPKFEYYYISVDTGYGNYSLDPVYGYIPNPGGSWLQQQAYTSQEERVRSILNHSAIRYNAKLPRLFPAGFSNAPVKFRANINLNRKARIDTNLVLQNHFAWQTEIKVNPISICKSFYYNNRYSESSNQLYVFGGEDAIQTSQELGSEWDVFSRGATIIRITRRTQFRSLVYNPIQDEDWAAWDFQAGQRWEVDSKQEIDSQIGYSHVVSNGTGDQIKGLDILFKHHWFILRRGRVEQSASWGQVTSDQTNIPYSILEGQQPGQNWEYKVNGSYRFTNAFQLQLNYSIRKRGLRNTEQYFRMEGRAYF